MKNNNKPYSNIPGTTVFDGDMARIGFHLNQFCMSLMQASNRDAFKQDERAYLDKWPMTEAQKKAVLARDFTQLIALGGNIYYLVKISSNDGLSVAAAVSTMTNLSVEDYMEMMRCGGRSSEGNRYVMDNHPEEKQ
ncbi:protocatechuate 4,5-dioxygenase subunit alpha [Marinomonas sp. M1K-6]|uniref:Protocatechuate 4,5-dioxygenase subunit alpha n=1 Tax=Marinomonas profundi TaxID=2726122 RepID=A0A847R4B8_9GAMM|nr:protocatechuate 4,5-dioxygenase subunit alpha [Marinomonas profundi]NLQ17303.1 protocatechuate 4,5-dioxygenase subunit alpha [Marinomonas profundi]UDV01832.1 protocatechuate 4,5-dioxygenase subunit alpha [Marinomonas profundi]